MMNREVVNTTTTCWTHYMTHAELPSSALRLINETCWSPCRENRCDPFQASGFRPHHYRDYCFSSVIIDFVWLCKLSWSMQMKHWHIPEFHRHIQHFIINLPADPCLEQQLHCIVSENGWWGLRWRLKSLRSQFINNHSIILFVRQDTCY